ncbi:hypothetical protein HDV00_006920 [Rhizophlyctis rosea]|nr:hypothetical protein HDV00_006920 [Rhizophlyctis rosea]
MHITKSLPVLLLSLTLANAADPPCTSLPQGQCTWQNPCQPGLACPFKEGCWSIPADRNSDNPTLCSGVVYKECTGCSQTGGSATTTTKAAAGSGGSGTTAGSIPTAVRTSSASGAAGAATPAAGAPAAGAGATPGASTGVVGATPSASVTASPTATAPSSSANHNHAAVPSTLVAMSVGSFFLFLGGALAL